MSYTVIRAATSKKYKKYTDGIRITYESRNWVFTFSISVQLVKSQWIIFLEYLNDLLYENGQKDKPRARNKVNIQLAYGCTTVILNQLNDSNTLSLSSNKTCCFI